MAIVNSYPIGTPKSSDLLVGTSIPDPNTNDDPKTSSFSVSSIGSFLITENNIITGGGTLNTIPLFTPDGQKINNSIITQNALGTTITVNGGLTVSASTTLNGALTVEGVSTFNDDIEVNNNATFYSSTTFEDTAEFQQGIGDSTASTGAAGQVLSSTGAAVRWIDAPGGAGTGTPGTLPIWISSTELGDSFLQKGTQTTSLKTSNATAASGESSIAIGSSAVASNQHSVAIGFGASATSSKSMAFGVSSTASGLGSRVIAGYVSSATGDYAVCGGLYTEAHDYGETVFGLYNKISTGNQTGRPISSLNNIFVVGNGNNLGDRSNALELNNDGELTLPFYATPNRRNTSGLAFDAVTGKIIPADSPNYTRGEYIVASAGGSTTLDIDTPGIVFLSWLFNGPDGTFTVNLPDIVSPSENFNYFYGRKFKFVLSNYGFSAGGKDVVLAPFSTQQINGASSFTIPSNSYNVVEIWNRGGEWIIISKLIN